MAAVRGEFELDGYLHVQESEQNFRGCFNLFVHGVAGLLAALNRLYCKLCLRTDI